MQEALADYILALAHAREATHAAADRPLYDRYIADAGVLLASAVRTPDDASLVQALRTHERLRGMTWLTGPEYIAPERAWERVVAVAPRFRP